MNHTWICLISPFVGLIVNAVLQVAGFRLFSSLTLLHSVFLGFACGLVVVIGVDWLWVRQEGLAVMAFIPVSLANVLIYGALGYTYFHFVNMGETARRIRIILELDDTSEGLTSAEILNLYNAKSIVDVRINRLIQNKQVVVKNGRYCIGNPTMLMMAKTISFMKWLLLGQRDH